MTSPLSKLAADQRLQEIVGAAVERAFSSLKIRTR